MARPKKKKKPTKNQQLYQKEVSRIKKQMSRMKKKGYVFFEEIEIPKPKVITKKALQSLKDISSAFLYRKSSYINQDTGEVITGSERRTQERKASAQKGLETKKRKQAEREAQERLNAPRSNYAQVVIEGYLSYIPYSHPGLQTEFARWIDELISKYGADAVADMLIAGSQTIEIDDYNCYNDDERTAYMHDMERYLNDEGYSNMDGFQDMMDSIEEENPSGYEID